MTPGPVFSYKLYHRRMLRERHKPYYTTECEDKRKVFLDALNVFGQYCNDANRQVTSRNL